MSNYFKKHVFDVPAQVDQACAVQIIETIQQKLDQSPQAKFTIALSGGLTPRAGYEYWASLPQARKIDWSRVHFFWSDERLVPVSHAESNVGMSERVLLDVLKVSENNRHRPLIQDGMTPATTAQAYAKKIEAIVGPSLQFDLILLGMGGDGHTASLFAGDDWSERKKDQRLVIDVAATATEHTSQPRTRISFSLKLINKAKKVFILVLGKEKSLRVQEVMSAQQKRQGQSPYPCGCIALEDASAELHWFCDAAANGTPLL